YYSIFKVPDLLHVHGAAHTRNNLALFLDFTNNFFRCTVIHFRDHIRIYRLQIKHSRIDFICLGLSIPPEGLKKLIDQLLKKQLYSPLPLAVITRESSQTGKAGT
ncbi:MAG: hypothetical protein WCP20_18515, partial [Desulfuromonadales bacterium]